MRVFLYSDNKVYINRRDISVIVSTVMRRCTANKEYGADDYCRIFYRLMCSHQAAQDF